MQNNNQTALYLVVGMHRSGTSCLAGSLEQLGLDFRGCGQQGTQANARGNRENRDIMIFHETILKSQGASWSAPPERVLWQPHHYLRAQALLKNYQAPYSAFKCPRTLLHWRQWLEIIPQVRIAAIVRHPMAVARSLAARDGMSEQQGLALWLHYNRELLALANAVDVAWFDFDVDAAQFSARLRAQAAAWQLPQAETDVSFRLEELRRSDTQGELPAEVLALYRELQARITAS